MLVHKTMSLAHGPYSGTNRDLDYQIQFEIREARRLQREYGITHSEALRIAAGLPASAPETR